MADEQKQQVKVLKMGKVTKRTVVYECGDTDAAISGVYVNKHFLGNEPPEELEITVKIR